MSDGVRMAIPVENEQTVLDSVEAITNPPTPEATETPEASATPETPEPTTPDDDAGLEIKEATPEEEAATEAVEAEGVDIDALFDEYAQQGELSEESTKAVTEALAKAGFKDPEARLAQYIAGVEASVALTTKTVHDMVGGADNYSAMISWAAENLSPAEQQAYNNAMKDSNMVGLAVQGLQARFQGAAGTQTESSPRVNPGANVNRGVAPVTSLEQIAELTGDPRFDTDIGYRQDVERRIQASIDAGHL